MDLSVEHIPKFRTLISGIPLAALIAEREYSLLGSRTLLVTPRATDRRIKPAGSQAVQCLNLMFGLDETAGLA